MKRASVCFLALPLLSLSLLFSTAGCSSKPTPADTADSANAALRARLSAHRAAQMERLHAYAVAGQFPHNMTAPTQNLHMFKDADGRLCAVANLVHQDGRDDLVNATVRDHNDLAIHDVHDGELMGWILDSGLTQEELARIQLPAPPMQRTHFDPAPKKPTPVDDNVASSKTKPADTQLDIYPVRPLPAPVVARDEDSMKALVRAHIAQVEAELRANEKKSLDLAVSRYVVTETRVASR